MMVEIWLEQCPAGSGGTRVVAGEGVKPDREEEEDIEFALEIRGAGCGVRVLEGSGSEVI